VVGGYSCCWDIDSPDCAGFQNSSSQKGGRGGVGGRNVLGNLVIANDTCEIHALTRSLSLSPSSPLLPSFLCLCVSFLFCRLPPVSGPRRLFLPTKWFNFRLSLSHFPVPSILYTRSYVCDIMLTFFLEANG